MKKGIGQRPILRCKMLKLTPPTVDDRSVDDFGEEILTNLLTSCPQITEFGPTSVTKQLTGAHAYFVQLLQYLANKAVQKLKHAYMEKQGLEKREASYATCDLTFTLHEALNHDYVITSGSRVQTNTTPPVIYATDETLTIPTGETTGTVSATAIEIGSLSRVTANQLTVLRTPLAYVSGVTNTASSGGEDEETDEEATLRLQGVLETDYKACTPSSFESLAEQVTGVYRAKCLPTTDYYAPTHTSPSKTVLLIQPATGYNEATVLSSVENYLEDLRVVGWDLDIRICDWVEVNPTLQIRTSLSNQAAVTALTTSFEEAFYDWEWGKELSLIDIRSIALSTENIVHCAVASPDNDVQIGKFALPVLGTVTVTT